MALPASWTLVPVTATYLRRDGTPAVGRVVFLSGQVVTIDDTIVVPKAIVAELDSTGSIQVDLPATNDPDIDPIGWTYSVEERLAGLHRDPWAIQVPHDSLGLDLADTAPVVPVDQVTTVLTANDLGTTVARQADLEALEDASMVDLVATPSTPASAAVTVQGHPDGSTGNVWLVQDPTNGNTVVGVTRFSLNSNVPIGCPFFNIGGMRLYLGATDPDPTAPNGVSVWIDASGVIHTRVADAWVPAA